MGELILAGLTESLTGADLVSRERGGSTSRLAGRAAAGTTSVAQVGA